MLFINPKNVDYGDPSRTNEYVTALQDAWNEFDKVPYQFQKKNVLIKHFVKTVIKPIGLQELYNNRRKNSCSDLIMGFKTHNYIKFNINTY
jgi:hypothetical protein